jgi:DNA-binding MarR family transcriptional regulator
MVGIAPHPPGSAGQLIPQAGEGQRPSSEPYILDDQVGFALRQASQRHATIFASHMIEDLTPTQWAAMAKLHEYGPCSQNLLGRLTAMDAATIKGVIDRLCKRGFTETRPDASDGRRLLVALTAEGEAVHARAAPIAIRITAETLAPLTADERTTIVALLRRMA